MVKLCEVGLYIHVYPVPGWEVNSPIFIGIEQLAVRKGFRLLRMDDVSSKVIFCFDHGSIMQHSTYFGVLKLLTGIATAYLAGMMILDGRTLGSVETIHQVCHCYW